MEYLGYDYRNYQNGKSEDDPFTSNDEMGIRKLHWVGGWPVEFFWSIFFGDEWSKAFHSH